MSTPATDVSDRPTPAAAPRRDHRRWLRLAAVGAVQLALVGVAVAGPLSARLSGTEYRFTVAPVDPMDPFRGSYVALTYPDLPSQNGMPPEQGGEGGRTGEVFVPLARNGTLWKGTAMLDKAPASGPYLRCEARGWGVPDCGIDSWFLPSGEASRVGQAVRDGKAVAVVKVDRWGHAALTDLRVS